MPGGQAARVRCRLYPDAATRDLRRIASGPSSSYWIEATAFASGCNRLSAGQGNCTRAYALADVWSTGTEYSFSTGKILSNRR